jgi:hypothetical protein
MVKIQGNNGIPVLVSPDGAMYVTDFNGDNVLGVYRYHLRTNIQATAHNGTTTAYAWLVNKVGSGRVIKIVKAKVMTQFEAALSAPTAPRTALARVTFSGTPSGAIGVPTKFDSLNPAPILDIRTASTGLTVTLDPAGPFWASLPVVSQGSAGWGLCTPIIEEFDPRSDDYEFVIREGEGLVLYQPENGTASDTRRLIAEIMWEEVN